MKPLIIIAGALAALNIAHAQLGGPMTVIGSASGQFFVSARNTGLSPHSLDVGRGPNMLTLEPPLLAVSCERIKKELLRELDMPDQWRGKIFVVLRPARTGDDPIFVNPQRLGGSWDCSVQLPDAVDRDRFLESIVRACLLEIANRNATAHSTEIPEWLVRGFTRQLMNSSGIKLILPPPTGRENGLSISRTTIDFTDAPRPAGRQIRRLNPLAEASDILRTNPPLSFDQLSWPTEEQLSSQNPDVFGCNAQLFVAELLQLNNGPAALRTLLTELPDYLNWQLAFLDAFHDSFQKPLDVEKWWALEVAAFSGRDLLHLLTPEESWKQFNAVFQFPIEVKIGDSPSMRTDISLQTVIRGWSKPQQLQLLKKKLWDLDLLRLRIAPEFVPVVDGYRQVLQDYYKKRSSSPRILAGLWPMSDKPVDETIDRLNVLDVERANLRPKPPVPVALLEQAVFTPGP
jgi:hypothetical protein